MMSPETLRKGTTTTVSSEALRLDTVDPSGLSVRKIVLSDDVSMSLARDPSLLCESVFSSGVFTAASVLSVTEECSDDTSETPLGLSGSGESGFSLSCCFIR